jgi:hypothetical protein
VQHDSTLRAYLIPGGFPATSSDAGSVRAFGDGASEVPESRYGVVGTATDVDPTWSDPSRLTRLLKLLGRRLDALQSTRAACLDPEAVGLLTTRIAVYRARHFRVWKRREEIG